MISTDVIKQGLALSETNSLPLEIGHSQTQIHRTQALIFRGGALGFREGNIRLVYVE